MMKTGFVLTTLWLVAIGVLLWFKWNDVLNMALSDWGAFLSGITAPVAFLWLVLGYLLQNKELKMNRESLETQTKALLVQAEAARAQVGEIQRQQVIRTFGSSLENRRNLRDGV